MKLSNQNHNNAIKITLRSDFFLINTQFIFRKVFVISTEGRNLTRKSAKKIANLCRITSEISPFGRNDKTIRLKKRKIFIT